MRKVLMRWIGKPLLVLLSGSTMGLVFGVLPCYLFPLFGANVRMWCGYKSEPPHFVIQFWTGFLVMAAIAIYFCYFRKR